MGDVPGDSRRDRDRRAGGCRWLRRHELVERPTRAAALGAAARAAGAARAAAARAAAARAAAARAGHRPRPVPRRRRRAGAICNGALTCFYEDCAGSGRTVASCVNGAWSVETGPCTGVFCQSQTCQPGEVCVITRRRRAAGRVRAERVRHRRGVVRLPAVVLRHLHSWRVAGVRRYHQLQHVSVRPVPVTGGQS